MISTILEYFDLFPDKERLYIFHFPLFWFFDELPCYVRFILASIIISCMLFHSGGTKHIRSNANRVERIHNKSPEEFSLVYNSDDDE